MKSDNPPPYNPEQNPPPPGFYPAQPGSYPPHPGSYPPQPVPVAVSTVTIVPGAIAVQAMGSQPQSAVCKSCNMQIITRIQHKSTTKTHLFALLLCLIGCWPCVCVPYCVDSCRNIDHYCTNCDSYIGSYVG